MQLSGVLRRGWIASVGVGLVGIALSLLAFWLAERADRERVRSALEFRADWRARDLEAKIRLYGNAVENVAIAIAAADGSVGPDQFRRIAARARDGRAHVNALQWAPRILRADIPAFEQNARALGQADYRVFDVDEDFQRTELSDRPEYFPVLFDERFEGRRRPVGLALGKFAGRRIPMELARDEGRPVATLPVRPIGPPVAELVYLIFWPVYDGIDVPATLEERRGRLRGYVVGNYNLKQMLTAAIDNTPELAGALHFSISAEHQPNPSEAAVVHFSPELRQVEIVAEPKAPPVPSALRIERHFEVFDQHWDLTFDYSDQAVAALRAQGAYGWLLAGLLLTGSLVLYLLRAQARTRQIETLVQQRTAELEQASAQLHQAQKMEAIGNMTGGMAHDFNNLLAVIIGNLDLLQERVKGDRPSLELVDAALQASARGADLTRQLLAFARRQPLAPRIIDVNELVSGMTRLLDRILEENIEVKLVTAPETWPVLIDPAQLSTAVANLATNARDAMPNGGRLTIETKNTHLDSDYAALNPEAAPGDYVLLEVSDTGTGMSAETLAQAFEPFFTTKEAGRGTGLGLSMVFGFVKQSQGHIKIYSELGHGTTVRLYLPRAERAEEAAAPAPAPQPEGRRHESILVVEDNDAVRDVVGRQLGELGYKVIEADRPQRALELLNDPALHVDLLFTDLVMPGMNGAELAEAAQAIRPELRILFTSGYSGSTLLNDARLKGSAHFLSKPYRKQDLGRKLREIFEG